MQYNTMKWKVNGKAGNFMKNFAYFRMASEKNARMETKYR